jgi:hypothetical protein
MCEVQCTGIPIITSVLPRLKRVLWFYRYPAAVFGFTQLIFLAVVLFRDVLLLPLNVSEPAKVVVHDFGWADDYWRWDAIHYYTIAVDGYDRFVNAQGYSGLMAFSPVLPLLLRLSCELLGGLPNPNGGTRSSQQLGQNYSCAVAKQETL